MASSIEIDIIANFKDNVTDKVQKLNAELDKLEKRDININVSATDRAAKIADEIDSKLSRIDGSSAAKEVDHVVEKVDAIKGDNAKITLRADTSAADRALDGTKQKIDSVTNLSARETMVNKPSTERLTEEVSEITRTSKIIDAQYMGHSQQALDYISEYESLKGQIAEYGIKISPTADLETMRNAVFEYEDRNFTPIVHQDSPELRQTAQEQGETVSSTYLSNLGEGMKTVTSKVASRFMGARMLYKGISDAASDFSDAFSNENYHDAKRSTARALTKSGLMGAGAAIGSLVPGGAILGAGAGALISTLFGDQLGDMFSGIHKSAEELKQARLDEIFGDISMQAADLAAISRGLLKTPQSAQMRYNAQSRETGYSLTSSVEDSYYGVKQEGSGIAIRNNLGIDVPKDDTNAFKESVKDFTDSAKKALLQNMYDDFASNDDLYGYGNWDATELSERYKKTYDELDNTTNELFKYIDGAFRDNHLSTEELKHIGEVNNKVRLMTIGSSPDEATVKSDAFKFLAKSGMLSEDSFNGLIDNVWSDYQSSLYDLALTRSEAALNGGDEAAANKKFWKDSNSLTESVLQSIVGNIHNQYSSDYQSALTSAWEGQGSGTGLRHFYEDDSQYDSFLSTARNSQQYFDEHGDPTYRTGAAGQLSGAESLITNSFGQISIEQQGIMNQAYAGIQPMLQQVESQAQAAKAQGIDTSSYLDEMMEMYQIGALGGDTSAQQKYAAMLMSSDKESVDLMNSVFGSDTGLMSKFMGSDFTDMWQFLHGGTDEINSQADEQKKALEGSAQKVADAAADGTEKQKAALEQSGEKTAEAAADGTEKIVDAVNDNADKVEDAAKDTADKANELGENILDAVSESLDKIDADMLSDSNIGEKLMSAIGEGIDTMDFENIEIGEQLMSAIGASVDTMDFSGVDIGARIMDGISASLELVDVSGITEPINTALTEINEIECNPVIDATDNATEIISGIQLLVDAYAGTTAAATLNANDNASSVISSVSSALDALDGKSATVSVNIQTNGSMPEGFAEGTSYAPGGLAYVNDDGSADPRELILHNGRYMMYEGRNVLTELSPGDKVFTSSQTKDILSGRSIPHFAGGLNNEVIEHMPEIIQGGIAGGANVTIAPGAVQLTIEVNGADGDVIEQIKERAAEFAEPITEEIERQLSAIFANASGGVG